MYECTVAALAPIAPKHPAALWKERADELLRDVLQHEHVALDSKRCASSVLLWMAKGSFGRAHRPEALTATARVLRQPDLGT